MRKPSGGRWDSLWFNELSSERQRGKNVGSVEVFSRKPGLKVRNLTLARSALSAINVQTLLLRNLSHRVQTGEKHTHAKEICGKAF